MLANVDGLVATDGKTADTVLEIKTARFPWDRVPDYYVSQVQHYMSVTNLSGAYVAVLFGGDEFRTFEVERDDAYIERLIEVEARFWEQVKKAVQPEIDGSESTHNSIRKSYDAEAGKAVELDPEVTKLIEWRANAKEMVSQYEAEVREAESKIMEALKNAEVGTIDGKSVVTWKTQSRSSIDTKMLKESYPEIAEEFTKNNSFRVLRIK
jgi:predicted phage-related endonuclease